MPRLPSHLRFAAISGVLAVSAFAQYTEIPATVAPGKFRLEMDALNLILDREGEDKYTAVGAGIALVTTGITERWDIQVGAGLFISQRYESGNFTESNSGIGDIYVRTKWNFYSDEKLSMAILPFVKIPSNSGGVGNDSVEGGIILPWEVYLVGGFTMNAMVELDLVRNAADDGYDALWYASASVSRDFTKRLSVYAEFDAQKISDGTPWQATLGVGAYLTVSELLSWDLVMYRGLSRGAPDWNPVVRVNIGF